VESSGCEFRSKRGLDEAAATTFGVDLLETFLFLSLLDNAERSDEETQNDGHKPINGRESVLKGIVRECGDGSDTEIGRDVGIEVVGKVRGHAEPAKDWIICRVEIPTALELILEGESVIGAQRRPFEMEFVALSEREEPDDAADNGDDEGVDDQEPVQDNEADGDVVPLHHGSNRH